MKIRIALTICIISIVATAVGQDSYTQGTITDSRDGKLYQTLKIGNTIWLAENMKFKTDQSTIIAGNELGIEADGFYYPYEETDKVCPQDFEIPRESDWTAYMDLLIKLKQIPAASMEPFHTVKKKVSGRGISVTDHSLQIFNEPNPLNLKISGMIQGGNLMADGAMTFWSRKDNSADAKFHLHISPNVYSNHTHKHHIIASKKKTRKFVVRCVKRI